LRVKKENDRAAASTAAVAATTPAEANRPRHDTLPTLPSQGTRGYTALEAQLVEVTDEHIKVNEKWSWWRARVQRVVKTRGTRGRDEAGGRLIVLYHDYLDDEEADAPDTVDLGDCVVAPAGCPARVMHGD
jgi:hypothetical protein